MKTSCIKTVFLLFIIFLIALPVVANAQGRQRNWQEHYRQLESKRVAYLTSELSLTPEEAQVFWPVYNQYNQNKNQMMIRHRRQRTEDRELDQLSEKELLELADADLKNMEEMIKLRREYHEKFLQILPTIKVVRLYEAERDFNRRLYQDNRGGRRRD